VKVHSVNEGDLDPTTASGKMQIGVHGVFAQYYRDHIVENVRMGMRQAAETGRWQNRAPTGYDMVNGELVPNEAAPLVRRVFELRAEGKSYPAIESEVGFKYSTVRHICENRVYLGETRLRDEWFPGNHPAVVSVELFDTANRSHIPGRRRSKDMLSGKARCGPCGRVAGIEYNERNEGIYRCKHRGKGARSPVGQPRVCSGRPSSLYGSSRTTRTSRKRSGTI
jgi:site-specific DNA recombinase